MPGGLSTDFRTWAGITLLEIPYTEFDRIESILDKNLNDKDCGIVKGDA